MIKLVRENTKQTLRAPKVVFKKLDEGALILPHFIAKFLEEIGELNLANTKDQVKKELADIQEIIWAYGELYGLEPIDIHYQAMGKRDARGRFRGDYITIEEDTVEESTAPTSQIAPRWTAGDGMWYSG